MRRLLTILLFVPFLLNGQTWHFLIPSDTTETVVTYYKWNQHVYDSTFWRDAIVSGLSMAGGVQAPSLRIIKGGIKGIGYNYQTANDISYGTVQFNHDMLLGSNIHAHFHYMIEAAPSAGDTVVIEFEYTWADINEAFPTSDTITCKIPVASKSAGTHYIYEIGELTEAGGEDVSSIINFRVERLYNNASDTYDSADSWWILLDTDFHAKVKYIVSATEYNQFE